MLSQARVAARHRSRGRVATGSSASAFVLSARRLLGDAHVLLAAALVVPVLAVEALAADPHTGVLAIASGLLLGVQVALFVAARRVKRSRRHVWPTVRLLVALTFVAFANAYVGDAPTRPVAALYVPVVAMAAAIGRTEVIVVGGLALVGYLAALVVEPGHLGTGLQRGVVLTITTTLLAVGTRRTVSTLESTSARLRESMSQERRRAREIESVEAVGRVLASDGPTPAVLDGIVHLFVRRFGYTYVSIYVASGSRVMLGAQHGYAMPVVEFDGNGGVMGRVMRTREPAFIPDATRDPDFIAAEPGLSGEICVPLVAGGDLLGVVNVESMTPNELDVHDLEAIELIADRLASAMALSRQRIEVATRAELFARLATFSAVVNATLETNALHRSLVRAGAAVVPSDSVVLVVLDRAAGEYRIAAIEGGDVSLVDARIEPGEGMSGRAIRDRVLVASEQMTRDQLPQSLREAKFADRMSAAAVPLMRDGVVVGAMTFVRAGSDRHFSAAELEVLSILGHQAALAVSNAFLHADVTESSLRDPLTGLFNRRFLDVTLERMTQERARLHIDARQPISAILFDLDLFGGFNKQHGHRVGDSVLRTFASVLRRRLRASDLIARYGGEEFLVVLPGSDRENAARIADEIRLEFRNTTVTGADGTLLGATVSAGCTELDRADSNVAGLMEAADVGLAMAKIGGRDQVVSA